jgi:hypothetical protein
VEARSERQSGWSANRNLPYASDPKRNGMLKFLTVLYLDRSVGDTEKRSKEEIGALRQRALKDALQVISTGRLRDRKEASNLLFAVRQLRDK